MTISIHPPRAGRDYHRGNRRADGGLISIHPPRAGRDSNSVSAGRMSYNFNPPAPCGAGLYSFKPDSGTELFQSTRPVRGGTTESAAVDKQAQISIHPPRAGRDFNPVDFYREALLFQSTRPVRGGTLLNLHKLLHCLFQSTRPVRGGTRAEVTRHMPLRFQSTRPVRGGTAQPPSAFLCGAISIHPPRAGRDQKSPRNTPRAKISIHPPRAGRDDHCGAVRGNRYNFNPPAPCGAGPLLPRPPSEPFFISIHPPRAGRDMTDTYCRP